MRIEKERDTNMRTEQEKKERGRTTEGCSYEDGKREGDGKKRDSEIYFKKV